MISAHALTQFIQKHHVMCLATHGKMGPHACPVFYAFDPNALQFIFVSDTHTRHMQDIASASDIAAGIYLETENTGLIQGVQIWGSATIKNESQLKEMYFKRFPFSQAFLLTKSEHVFCILKIKKARLIDNKLGFGKNKEWSFD